MSKLFKYEFRKTRFAKLILFGITAVLEAIFLIGIMLGSKDLGSFDNIFIIAAVLLLFAGMFGVFIIGIQSVLSLHRDMNTKQGYMLYMTPCTSYQILGAKMAENGISIFLTGGLYFLIGLANCAFLLARYGRIEYLWARISELLYSLGIDIRIGVKEVLVFILLLLSSWLAVISAAYLADIISSSLLNGKRFNGILAFVIFIALSIAQSRIARLVPASLPDLTEMIVQSIVALGFSAVLYVISAVIMDKFLSV